MWPYGVTRVSAEEAHGDAWYSRLRLAFLDRVERTGHARPYSAADCEEVMRRVTNGERGCANPAEHRGR